eukprot:3639447-Rhodomonas_salina.1
MTCRNTNDSSPQIVASSISHEEGQKHSSSSVDCNTKKGRWPCGHSKAWTSTPTSGTTDQKQLKAEPVAYDTGNAVRIGHS